MDGRYIIFGIYISRPETQQLDYINHFNWSQFIDQSYEKSDRTYLDTHQKTEIALHFITRTCRKSLNGRLNWLLRAFFVMLLTLRLLINYAFSQTPNAIQYEEFLNKIIKPI